MTGKGMKLSSFTKYLRLRVINTKVAARVARRACLVTGLFILLVCPAYAQDAVARPTKGEAQAAWDRGDIEKAYNQYNGLLLLYTRDPLYQFYTGACLVRLERDIQRAVTLLSSAINSSVNIKSVPDEVWFYYGRALQMSGSFSQAKEAYARFARQAGRKGSADYDLQRYIDQCNAGAGTIRLSEPPVTAAREATGDLPPVTSGKETMPFAVEKEAVTETVGKETEPVTTQEKAFPVTSGKIPAAHEMSSPSVKLVVRGNTAGIRAESFEVLGEALERPQEADSLLLALEDELRKFKDTTPVLPEEPPVKGHLSLFSVSHTQAYSDASPVPVEPVMPDGLIYTIQIGAFRNNVAPSLFRGLFPVFGKKRQGSEAVYYYAGMFRRIDDARKELPYVREAGFPDAFIIAMMDGTQVSMERAALLEKEWGSRPFISTSVSTAGKTSAVQVFAGKTSPGTEAGKGTASEANERSNGQPVPVGTLSFRAEVMRISKPVKPEVIQKLELLAGTRGLEMIKNSNGETVFLIGKFITFESADEYVSLLIRNGYSEAKVAAYVGMQEIPVDAARELLNKMPDD